MQSVYLPGLGVDAHRAEREVPFLAENGEVFYGHRAIAAALLTGGPGVRAVGRILNSTLLERPAAVVYRWTARNRQSLPGSSDTCAIPLADE
jgi:predicted DCC family thiol-disulfide oxidoreductase YuxK